MFVRDYANALMTAPHSRWKYVKKPYHVHTDEPWRNGVLVWQTNQAFVADHDGQYIYPQPLVVYHNQASGYGVDDGEPGPELGWEDTGSVPFNFQVNRPHGFVEFHLTQNSADADTGLFEAKAQVSCQGVTFLWARADQDAADSTVPDTKKFTTFRFGVGENADTVLYTVTYTGQGEVSISKSYDQGVTWQDLESLRQRGEYAASFGVPGVAGLPSSTMADIQQAPTNQNYLEVRLIGGRLIIWTGSNGPYIFDEWRVGENGQIIWQINSLMIRAYKFLALDCSAHPTKWKPECIYDSPEIPIGFNNEQIAQPFVDAAGIVPPGWFANVYEVYPGSLFGPIAEFRLVLGGPVAGTFRGEDYADYCAACRSIQLTWLPEILYNQAAGIPMVPERIEVSHTFNPANLQITSEGSMIFNNTRERDLGPFGVATMGEWSQSHGQFAVDIEMNRTTPDGVFPLAERVFTGFAHTRGETNLSHGASNFVMHLASRDIQLRNPRYNLPWMDGWNSYYAQFYLTEQGHIHWEDLDYLDRVPDRPFGEGTDLGSPETGLTGAYYLPVGDAGSILTRFSGAELWDVKCKIAYAQGYLLFYDVYGREQFRKFRMPDGVKRTFFESDRESAIFNPGGGLEGCWNLRGYKDHGEVRNVNITIGMRAFTKYEPIVYKWEDADSIYDPNAFNFLGYPANSVQMDSQFAVDEYAYRASVDLHRVQRMPGAGVILETWLQPDMFPLDMIMVQSKRAGTYGLRYMITSVRHIETNAGGSSQIIARYLPEML